MNQNTLASGTALGGVAVLAACACGAGSGMINALHLAGIHPSDTVIFGASCGTDHSAQPLFVGFGSLLILAGLSWRSMSAAVLAAIGIAALAVGSLVSGPSTMSSSLLPHSSAHLLGFASYVVAAVFLIAAFMRAFRSPQPLAAGTAMAGMAAATGCNCCMATGALSGLIASAGMPWVYGGPFVLLAGAALMAVGLWRLGGIKPAMAIAAGTAISYGGPKLLGLAMPELMIYGVNFRFVPGYAIYLLGAATMIGGFVIAYRLAQKRYVDEPLARALAEPVLVSAGDMVN